MRCGRVQKRGRQREQSLGRSRGGFSSKIHLLVDALGFPLRFILTGAERHDITQAESLLAPFHFDAVIADKGYDSDSLRILLAANIQVSMDGRGRALDNVFCERLWRSVKYENIYLQQYDSVRQLQAGLSDYFDFYNHERPHQSLNYRTPAEEHFVL